MLPCNSTAWLSTAQQAQSSHSTQKLPINSVAEPAPAAAAGCSIAQPMQEESWLSEECSKLFAAAVGLAQEHSSCGQRRMAMPAANRAMLERQVSYQ